MEPRCLASWSLARHGFIVAAYNETNDIGIVLISYRILVLWMVQEVSLCWPEVSTNWPLVVFRSSLVPLGRTIRQLPVGGLRETLLSLSGR